MIHRGALTSLLTAVLTSGAVAPVVHAAPGAGAAPGAAAPAGPTVTLLTGDTVTVGGLDGAYVRPAKGRERITFDIRTDEKGDTHVIPADAVVPLSQGKLDPRLFDVTELARIGYDDAKRSTLPLIVDYAGPTPRSAAATASRELPAISATAVSVKRSAAYWPTARKADHVWLDGPVKASLDQSVPQIGAPEAWAAGYTGAGTTVAVLDTGIDATHPDLSDAIAGAKNFTDSDSDDDRFGHGTHVASIITGSGAKYKGVAPDAKLLNGKVLNDYGSGTESWIIAGMEWAADSGADVINMSLGSSVPTDGNDPMAQAVNRITAETGALFVIAAGNSGPGNEKIGSPGSADAALTVGAVDKSDRLADFSSRGPRLNDGAIKPEITAPGVNIVAAKAKNGVIGTPVEDGYVSLSGTSMATPHVAGAAAILAGEHPDWTADQLKATLMGTAKPGDYTVFEQGAGRVDVARATTSTVSASPASINNGIAQWPHDDDQPIVKSLTYTNSGAEPVTLDLAFDGPDAPQGMFTLEPAQLTVPAGGQATATVTTDTKVDTADGVYSGVITATGGGQSVRTPVAVNRESERYNVTLKVIDQTGAPTSVYQARFVDVNNPVTYEPYDSSGTVTVRLPKGEYYFDATVLLPVESERRLYNAEFVEPSVMLTHDTTLVLDAREAKPFQFDLDKPNARVGRAKAHYTRVTAWGGLKVTAYLSEFGGKQVGTVKSATTSSDKFTFMAEARLAEWNGEAFTGSYLYNIQHTEKGTVPATLRWRYRDQQFAKVRSEHAAVTPGMTGFREEFLPVALPSTLTEYYTPDVPWDGEFFEATDLWAEPVSYVYQLEPRSFTLGRTTTEHWNTGVFGPSLPKGLWSPGDFGGRLGDRIVFSVPMATDQGRGRMDGTYGEGTTTLLRDGQVVGEYPYSGLGGFDVGPERATYTVRTSMSRPAAVLSSQIDVEWTFASEHSDAPAPVALPMPALRFAPNLDGHNAAPAGKRFTIPMYVQRNGTGEVGQVNTPAVEVSYDDGTTWQPAKVACDGGNWKATVNHPAGATFASLRSTVTDLDGNTERQTIIRAYALA